jgi:hypothetical protein
VLIEKSMVRSRSGRYQTAMEFRDALLRFLRHHNPQYRRTKLARLMKRLWQHEIEAELRALEDYVLDESAASSFGKNLIADALGPDPAYSHFNPNPTRVSKQAEVEQEPEDPVHRARTEIIDSRHGHKSEKPISAGKGSKERRTAQLEDAGPQPQEPTVVTGPRRGGTR